MKVLSTDGLTKLIQLIKNSFISVDNTVATSTTTLATVATSGSYNDLSDKPTVNVSGGGLQLCDIGTSLSVDDMSRCRLNGQIIQMSDELQPFLEQLKLITTTYPDLLCTEDEWQTAKTLSSTGKVDKFVLNKIANPDVTTTTFYKYTLMDYEEGYTPYPTVWIRYCFDSKEAIEKLDNDIVDFGLADQFPVPKSRLYIEDNNGDLIPTGAYISAPDSADYLGNTFTADYQYTSGNFYDGISGPEYIYANETREVVEENLYYRYRDESEGDWYLDYDLKNSFHYQTFRECMYLYLYYKSNNILTLYEAPVQENVSVAADTGIVDIVDTGMIYTPDFEPKVEAETITSIRLPALADDTLFSAIRYPYYIQVK